MRNMAPNWNVHREFRGLLTWIHTLLKLASLQVLQPETLYNRYENRSATSLKFWGWGESIFIVEDLSSVDRRAGVGMTPCHEFCCDNFNCNCRPLSTSFIVYNITITMLSTVYVNMINCIICFTL